MIVVTAAGGRVGRRIVNGLLEKLPPAEVAVAVRRPEAVADFAARGVAVHRADYEEPAALEAALAGARKVMFISSHADNATRLRQHKNVVDAAARAGAGHIVYTSFYHPVPENPFPFAAVHHGTEQHIFASGLPYTFLRDNFYADNVVRELPAAREHGLLRWPTAQGRTSYVARDDVAAVAVAALTEPGHEHQAYDMTGPEALTNTELAALLGGYLGREVKLEVIPMATYRRELLDKGAPDWAVEGAAGSFPAVEQGYCDGISDAIPRILGRPAMTVKEVLERYGEG